MVTRLLKISILCIFFFVSNSCNQVKYPFNNTIKAKVEFDIVAIRHNPMYNSGLVLRYRIKNESRKDVFILKPQVSIWKVTDAGKLQVYDYLSKYHHISPDVEFSVLDSNDYRRIEHDRDLGLSMVKHCLGADLKKYKPTAQDLVISASYLFIKKNQESQFVYPITGIQLDEGKYKILLQQQPSHHPHIPNVFRSYHFDQPGIESDTFTLIIR